MLNTHTLDVIWWITVVEIPALTALFWLIWRTRRDQDEELRRQGRAMQAAGLELREALAAYKLEVAKTYVSMAYLKDVERRLTGHLLRIEAKIDGPVRVGTGGQS